MGSGPSRLGQAKAGAASEIMNPGFSFPFQLSTRKYPATCRGTRSRLKRASLKAPSLRPEQHSLQPWPAALTPPLQKNPN